MIPMAGTADDLVLFATQTSAARQQVQHPLWVDTVEKVSAKEMCN